MKLIKLTEIFVPDIEVPVFINANEIAYIRRYKKTKTTFLTLTGGDVYRIKETPEEIIELIKNAKEI